MNFRVTVKTKLRWSIDFVFEGLTLHPSQPQIVRRLHEVIPDKWKELRQELVDQVNAGEFVSVNVKD